MNATLIDRYNEVVRADDEVYHVGDFSIHEKHLEVLGQLNGRKYLVPGNHDKIHPTHKKKAERYLPLYEEVFDAILDPFHFKLDVGGSTPISVSHIPWGSDRYNRYCPDLTDLVGQICGHVHEKWKVMTLSGKVIVNVGVDQWDFRPVPLTALLHYFSAPTTSV